MLTITVRYTLYRRIFVPHVYLVQELLHSGCWCVETSNAMLRSQVDGMYEHAGIQRSNTFSASVSKTVSAAVSEGVSAAVSKDLDAAMQAQYDATMDHYFGKLVDDEDALENCDMLECSDAETK